MNTLLPKLDTVATDVTSAAKRTAVFLSVAVILALALIGVILLSAQVSARNYLKMAEQGQSALGEFARQVRQVKKLACYRPLTGPITSLAFVDYDDQPLSFTFDANRKALYRGKGGVTNVLLRDCDSLQFTVQQSASEPLKYAAANHAALAECKVVGVTWTCSRKDAGRGGLSNIVQSLQVTLRSR